MQCNKNCWIIWRFTASDSCLMFAITTVHQKKFIASSSSINNEPIINHLTSYACFVSQVTLFKVNLFAIQHQTKTTNGKQQIRNNFGILSSWVSCELQSKWKTRNNIQNGRLSFSKSPRRGFFKSGMSNTRDIGLSPSLLDAFKYGEGHETF